MTTHKRPTLVTWRHYLATLLILLGTNSTAQNRSSQYREGEIAVELFGLIAIQSKCDLYVVAWINRVTRQVEAKCAETIERSEQIANSTGAETRFLIDAETAKADYKKRFGLTSIGRSASVLVHLLATERTERRSKFSNAPLLIYLKENQGKSSSDVNKSSDFSSSRPKPISIFTLH